MSKADITTTTATISGLPSRRWLLLGSGVVATLAAAGLPAIPSHAAPADPVLALYTEWKAIKNANDALHVRHKTFRLAFVRRYGEMLKPGSDVKGWLNDPHCVELDTLTQQCNDLSDHECEALDALIAMPATSAQGIACKVDAMLNLWRFVEHKDPDNVEEHESLTVAVLRDAARVLGEGAVT